MDLGSGDVLVVLAGDPCVLFVVQTVQKAFGFEQGPTAPLSPDAWVREVFGRSLGVLGALGNPWGTSGRIPGSHGMSLEGPWGVSGKPLQRFHRTPGRASETARCPWSFQASPEFPRELAIRTPRDTQ